MIKSAQIFKIPICVDNFGLEDLAELLRRIAEEDSTVSTCRLAQSTKFLKVIDFSVLIINLFSV